MIGSEITHTIDDLPISGLELHATHTSNVPVTLFLHGWGGNAHSFQPLWEALQSSNARFTHLIAPDLPGFGHTPQPPAPWNVGDYASCVVKYIDTLGSEAVDIVCHSFGGRITTKLLETAPHRIRKIVYIAPAGIVHHEPRITTIRTLAKRLKPIFELPGLRNIFPAIRSLGYRLIGSHDYLKTSGIMRETFKQVIAEDLSHLLPNIKKSVEIFWGRNDSYVPVSDGEFMKQQIANAHLTIFEDGRHGIHLTHAAPIANRIDQFLYH